MSARALLDTNIIIHRENNRVTNYSIGYLFRWLDKLKYEKKVHPHTISEIGQYRDPKTQEALTVKLQSYDVIKEVTEPDEAFIRSIGQLEISENDRIDNYFLYEVHLNHVDILITEDRRLRDKASKIGLGGRVFSINAFISKVTAENPDLIAYKALSVEKVYFGAIKVEDKFFDSFRDAYKGFDEWFARKCDEEAYICCSDTGNILGFLYLKTEEKNEKYLDITPPFLPKRRLKVGTFKVESTGFRLGERFIKIIFDNAQMRNVDEIYVTLFTDRDELVALGDMLLRWGFEVHGEKLNSSKVEKVLVKHLNVLKKEFTPKKNFPNISYNCNKYILPIYPEYHTTLLPDSQLNTESRVDFLGREPHRYALQKVYISWAPVRGVNSGDLIMFYRMAKEGEIKKYKSVVTTVGMVDEIIEDISSEKKLLQICENRSVFTADELRGFWTRQGASLKVLKFIFVKSLTRRLNLFYLWDKNIVPAPGGPRPFTRLADEQFDMILHDSGTKINFIK